MRTRRARTARRTRFALLALGLMLMVVAWIAATLPFAAPDEASHYDRALGLSRGQILGPQVPYTPNPGLTSTEMAFLNHDTRAIRVPAPLAPPNVTCMSGKPNLASCLVATPNGNFPPLGYVLPALALRASHDVNTGLWLTRAVSALQSIAFLLLAAALLWNGSGWSVLGLLAAVTPMVLFTGSVMNSSGIAIAACLAVSAAVLRVTRDPQHSPGWAWLAFGLAGIVAILTGPIGLVFVLADVLLFVSLVSYHELSAVFACSAVRACALSLLGAAVVALAYSRLAGFSATFGISPLWSGLRDGVHQLWFALQGAVGNFASLTIPLPHAAYWVWWLLVIGLLAAALWLGTTRERLVGAGSAILALSFPVLFYAWIDRHTGFGLQGREVLPVLMLIPLVAGEVICRHQPTAEGALPAHLVLCGAVGLVALFHAYAWWLSARVAAGAPHTIRFFAHATWRPPLGWLPWIIAAIVGTMATAAFALSEVVDPSGVRRQRRAAAQGLETTSSRV